MAVCCSEGRFMMSGDTFTLRVHLVTVEAFTYGERVLSGPTSSTRTLNFPASGGAMLVCFSGVGHGPSTSRPRSCMDTAVSTLTSIYEL